MLTSTTSQEDVLADMINSARNSKPKEENERKFRIYDAEFDKLIHAESVHITEIEIEQYWFKFKGDTYRARKTTQEGKTTYVLEFKVKIDGTEHSKREFPIKITKDIFDFCKTREKYGIKKTRYVVADKYLNEVVVDKYENGIIILEREFMSPEEAFLYSPEPWLENREVTNIFSSRKLAKWLKGNPGGDFFLEAGVMEDRKEILH